MLRSRVLLLMIIGIMISPSFISSQELTWSVDFNTIFDNGEGDDKYTTTVTTFQTKLAPEIGISMMNGTHRIAGGAAWIQPLDNRWHDSNIAPTLYYRFDSPLWKFSMGMFPRTQLIQPLPSFLLSDSLMYNQANIRGALVQYVREQGFFEAYLDWRGMQSETKREAFNIVFQGEWTPRNKMLILGGRAMMNHLAKQKNPVEEQNIVDNFLVNPYIGVDLSKVTPLDSFTIKGGMIVALDRDRKYDNWNTPCGAWADVTAEWKFLGVKNTLYAGGKLFPYYQKFGSQLDLGEPFYQSKFYNRTKVYAYIMRNWFMNLEASLDFRVAEDNFSFNQKLLLRVFIDNQMWKNRKASHAGEKLRNIY